jgi:hypothetical protein
MEYDDTMHPTSTCEMTAKRIHAMPQLKQQQQEELRAYFRWAGYNPNQQQ